MMESIARYKILEEIGRGSMGAVYMAHDPTIDRLVAIKVIELAMPPPPDEQRTFHERFLVEARSAGKLSHPNIVTVYDVGIDERPFIVMEYVPGDSLATLLHGGVPPAAEVRAIAVQLGSALSYAHQHGVVHRDVKLSNVLYRPGPDTKLVDFGIAKLEASELTSPGEVLGTPDYMPPETFVGAPIDGRSDLFSLGVVLYQLLTGQRPFHADNMSRIVYRIVNDEPTAPRQLNPGLEPGWDTIIGKLLAKDPGTRYQTGAELVADLENMDGLGTGAAPAVAPATDPAIEPTVIIDEPPRPLGRRWRSLASALLVSLLLVVVAARVRSLASRDRLDSSPQAQQALLDEASAALDRGEVRRATAKLEKLLKINPAHAGARELLLDADAARWQRRLPLAFEAKHDHRLGACVGKLVLTDTSIVFNSPDHGTWTWPFGEIRNATRDSKWRLRLTTYESEVLKVGAPKNYNFSLLSEPLDDDDWRRYSRLMDLNADPDMPAD